jgi:hypothetical protein
LAIIAGGAILVGIVGAYAVQAGRRVPWIMVRARRARTAWRNVSAPVLARLEKRARILVSDVRAWARDHMVSHHTPR